MSSTNARETAAKFRSTYNAIKSRITQMIVGQEGVIDGVMTALVAGGHVLLEGVPGLGKTMLVRSLSAAIDAKFSRIQFTPDMMPADIQGTWVLLDNDQGRHELRFQEGPLVANLVLADEINRATPKTQSALLQAMQERQITVGKRTIDLAEPFCVLATQNPVEQEGTYPLPEAQLDRFLLKLVVGYPSEEEYGPILDRTVGDVEVCIQPVVHASGIVSMRSTVRAVPVPAHVQQYAIRVVIGTQPGSRYAPKQVNEYVSLGSSPRGAQALLFAAKVRALNSGRFAVSIDDVRHVALPALRHRVLINFHAQADRVTDADIIEAVVGTVPAPFEVAS